MTWVRIALVLCIAMMVGIVFWVCHPTKRRLYFLSIDRAINDTDRERARRVSWTGAVTGVLCAAIVLWAEHEGVMISAALAGLLVPNIVMTAAMVRVLRREKLKPVPSAFVVPVQSRPRFWDIASAKKQIVVLLLCVAAFVWIGFEIRAMPEQIPIHWNAKGVADRFGRPANLWMMGWILIFQVGLLLLFIWGTIQMRFVVPKEHGERYAALDIERRRLLVGLLEAVELVLVVGFLGIWAGMVLSVRGSPSGLVVLPALLLGPAILVSIALYMGRLMAVADSMQEIAQSDVLGTRPEGWRWGGILYYAPNDTAVFVPKRTGLGLTLNMGRPISWGLLLGITGVPIVAAVLFPYFIG